MNKFIPSIYKLVSGRVMDETKKRTIYMYKGEGACPKNNVVTMASLKQHLDMQVYNVKYITPEETKDGEWRKTASLYVIGGGYDLGFIKCLGSHGTRQIRDFVKQGGRYLGICAGAYFACDYIEFDKDGPQEVCGDRDLKFYPGGCIGPLYGPYDYNSYYGARAAPLCCNVIPTTVNESSHSLLKSFHSYYSGGGCFIPDKIEKYEVTKKYNHKYKRTFTSAFSGDSNITPPPNKKIQKTDGDIKSDVVSNGTDIDNKKHVLAFTCLENKSPRNGFHLHNTVNNDSQSSSSTAHSKGRNSGHTYSASQKKLEDVDVLASYSEVVGQPAAIVKCKVGSGIAVLSSVHIEYDTSSMDSNDNYLAPIIEKLRQYDVIQASYFKYLLKCLDLETK